MGDDWVRKLIEKGKEKRTSMDALSRGAGMLLLLCPPGSSLIGCRMIVLFPFFFAM